MNEPPDEPVTRTVRVPIRRAAGVFASPEYAAVPDETADQWSELVWHDAPPR